MRTFAALLIAAGLILSPDYKLTTCDPCEFSTTGVTVLRQFEGFYPFVYKDSGGRPTIGFGHLIREGESFKRITPAEAVNLLKSDLRPKEEAINRDVSRVKYQAEYDAIVCLVFNIGEGAFHKSRLRGHIQQADKSVGPLWVQWQYVNGKPSTGLLYRRRMEYALYSAR